MAHYHNRQACLVSLSREGFDIYHAYCLSCGRNWEAACEPGTALAQLECPQCHEQNSRIMKRIVIDAPNSP